jgi:hypothetical protein
MPQSQLPLEALPDWARLHDVSYHDVNFETTEHKGAGLVATTGFSESQSDKDLLRIPRELILSQDAVDEYSKVDHNFKELLDLAGRQVRTPTLDICIAQSPYTI